LFRAMLESCANEPGLSGAELLQRLKDSDVNRSTLDEFSNSPATDDSTALHHALIVAEKARQRRLIDILSNILHDAYQNTEGCDAVIKRAKKRLTDLQREAQTPRHGNPS
jgi:replicative DNA helicase